MRAILIKLIFNIRANRKSAPLLEQFFWQRRFYFSSLLQIHFVHSHPGRFEIEGLAIAASSIFYISHLSKEAVSCLDSRLALSSGILARRIDRSSFLLWPLLFCGGYSTTPVPIKFKRKETIPVCLQTGIKNCRLLRIKKIYMGFFTSAVDVLQTLVIALGAGLGVWGAINLLEGYGNDNPGANAHVR